MRSLQLYQIPSPPNEPTSTLVLTSYTSYYVDVRILTSALSEAFASSDPQHNIVEWAFAGKSYTTTTTRSGSSAGQDLGEPSNHVVWEHWIDSKPTNSVADEGDMYIQPNGDVLERGIQKDPLSGEVVGEYEELWTDLPVETVPAEDIDSDSDKKMSVVIIRTEDGGEKVTGMVVRVGRVCQGVMTTPDGRGLDVERWKYVEKEGEGGEGKGGWRPEVKVGVGMMPCLMTFKGVLLTERMQVPGSGGLWRVVEVCRWVESID